MLGLLAAVIARPAAAQRVTPDPVVLGRASCEPWCAPSGSSTERAATAKLFPRAPDHRYEGAVVGLVTLGVAGGVLAHALCQASDDARHCTGPTIGASLLMGGIGALTGALVGGLFPKAAPED
jgi:hypothetical protein